VTINEEVGMLTPSPLYGGMR